MQDVLEGINYHEHIQLKLYNLFIITSTIYHLFVQVSYHKNQFHNQYWYVTLVTSPIGSMIPCGKQVAEATSMQVFLVISLSIA